jgi:hypothetical protein
MVVISVCSGHRDASVTVVNADFRSLPRLRRNFPAHLQAVRAVRIGGIHGPINAVLLTV